MHSLSTASGGGYSVRICLPAPPPLAITDEKFLLLDLNIPICGFAAVLVLAFLKLRVPQGTFWEKLNRIDWLYVSIGLFHLQCC